MRGRNDNWRNGGGGGMGGGGGGGGGSALKMRGIPFRATEGDVYAFFAPLRPTSIEMLREGSGRPSGEARVFFSSRPELDDALQKDKQYMGTFLSIIVYHYDISDSKVHRMSYPRYRQPIHRAFPGTLILASSLNYPH